MSRFYGSLTGSAQTTATRRGTPSSGIHTHTRGWNVGVAVSGDARAEDDLFGVDVTAGSNGNGRQVPLATVSLQSGGVRVVTLSPEFGGGSFVIDERGTVVPIDQLAAEAEARVVAEDEESGELTALPYYPMRYIQDGEIWEALSPTESRRVSDEGVSA